ncbi:NAD(+)--dinitrogen-reductase ADP-D-ribosyltransferase [Vibrio ulleungensis]|uniref:NAD(+)--dinitrogen-reductase ADP-D-ribosyltransferase n=1 Tax=Vibrio ulleungensis TaxID=2807619 RepID=UPI002E2B2BC9|nr:NAD(+)--dinitrogen-reductase ADP-D-ribosyltransferase [Vibrio ulleungensis]
MTGQSHYRQSEQERLFLKTITLPFNHCNLPSILLASLAYQSIPVPLYIYTLEPWLREFRKSCMKLSSINDRVEHFHRAMSERYQVHKPNVCDDGEVSNPSTYRKILIGWLFDSGNQQGAVLRAWVESRFGLLTRYHNLELLGPDSDRYDHYASLSGYYSLNSDELFSQLDFLYYYCQLELGTRYSSVDHLTLYRGFSTLPTRTINEEPVYLFNNLSSMTEDPELALQFGTQVVKVDVPRYKIICFDSLLPGTLSGEREYMVLGGLYRGEQLRV